MITFQDVSKSMPYKKFKEKYHEAQKANQESIEAISISSFSKSRKEVNSRFVNLKFLIRNDFIFFSNYQSSKSLDFTEHNQVSALIYWNKIDTQIRMKAKIHKSPKVFSDNYFFKRSKAKNALAISSKQSTKVDSYDQIKLAYNDVFENKDTKIRPNYWGGYSFKPYYFEFWEGHKSRLNKRDVYEKKDDNWIHYFLQP
tara:strand:+ start:17969 stop:18565 length:597 start_codon:yes stop_codon:yes gene_type:complete